jgi:hypothetical protein
LLNLHEIIDKRLNEAKQGVDNVSYELEKLRFLEGRIQALSEFKEFLIDNLNVKLPRRIRKQLKGQH